LGNQGGFCPFSGGFLLFSPVFGLFEGWGSIILRSGGNLWLISKHFAFRIYHTSFLIWKDFPACKSDLMFVNTSFLIYFQTYNQGQRNIPREKKTPSLTTVMGRSKIRVATHVAGFPTSRVRCTGRSPGFHPDSEGGRNPLSVCSHQPQTL
jgi:hypothetical protein